MSSTDKSMTAAKRAALEAQGIRVTDSPAEHLGLSPERMDMIDLKMRLGTLIRTTRTEKKWTQAQLAEAMDRSQPAIALLERGAPSNSIEQYMIAMRILGPNLDLQLNGESLLSAAV